MVMSNSIQFQLLIRFANALALSLGYERIVKDKRITIEVDDSDDPWVTQKFQGCSETIRINASDENNQLELKNIPVEQEKISVIVDAVHQAYIDANRVF